MVNRKKAPDFLYLHILCMVFICLFSRIPNKYILLLIFYCVFPFPFCIHNTPVITHINLYSFVRIFLSVAVVPSEKKREKKMFCLFFFVVHVILMAC